MRILRPRAGSSKVRVTFRVAKRRRRPNLNEAIQALLVDLAARMPEYQHIDPSRVLVVAGEARRASRGTVKPLTFAGGKSQDARGRRKPSVKLRGRKMLYC